MNNKPIFSGMLHTGLPDFKALYGMGTIPMVTRQKYPGWPDKDGLPTAQWYQSLAADLVAPSGIALVDHEDWKYSTQTERLATGAKYAALYQGIKQVRPDLLLGWYMDPIRRDFWRAIWPRDSAQYLSWQAENNDLGSIMGPVTDVYMPSLYFFYTRDTYPLNVDLLTVYLEENIREAKRIRWQYGKNTSPIYPYVIWYKHNTAILLDSDAWETTVRVVLEQADGLVLWGGWQQAWDEAAPWWVTVKARLMCKRRQQPTYEGQLVWQG